MGAKVGSLKKQYKNYYLVLAKTPDNITDSQENQQMDQQVNPEFSLETQRSNSLGKIGTNHSGKSLSVWLL